MPGIVDEAGNAWHKEEEHQRQIMEGVEGSHLYIPMQCEVCWFQNIEGRHPSPGRDDKYLTCIRRANLDGMLGKSLSMIQFHKRETLAALKNAKVIGKMPTYHARGPFPISDLMGMSLVVDMLVKSLVAKGRIFKHIQFSTLRKMRSTYTKYWECSPSGVEEGAAFANRKYRVKKTSCLAQLEWFHDFLRGLKFRMGCQSDPNHGLLIGAVVHMLNLLQTDAEEAEQAGSTTMANELWKVGAYVCILTGASLQGHEGFYLEITGLRKHLDKGRFGWVPPNLNKSTLLTEEACRYLPHVTVCLLRKFKGEMGINHHLIVLANETISGLKPRWWIKKLVAVCKEEEEGRLHGPTFTMPDGSLAMSMDYDALFRKYLIRIQEEMNWIPPEEEIKSHYSANRTPHKTGVMRLEQAGFGDEFIDQVNRWRMQEQSKGWFV